MANLAKWAAGTFQGGAWSTSAQAGFASADLAFFNSLASGSCVVASSAVANGTNLDLYGEVSVVLAPSANPTAGAGFVGVFFLPLNQDGSTYGDGTPSGAAQSVIPGGSYWMTNISIRPVNSGFSAGTTLLRGTSKPLQLPRRDFLIAVAPTLGSALASSAQVTIALSTSLENLNG